MSINIKITPGLYTFGTDCSIGKSYLYEVMYSLMYTDKTYLAYRYNDHIDVVSYLLEYIDEAKYIMLDRANLYFDDKVYNLLSKYLDKVIMLDYKGSKFKLKYCDLEMTADGFEVS